MTVNCRLSATVSSEFRVPSSEFCDFLFSFAFSFLPFDFCLLPFDLLVSAVPHSLQNLALPGFSIPQDPQRYTSEAPHSLQNFAPSRFSNSQLEQRMLLLYSFGLSAARKDQVPRQAGIQNPSGQQRDKVSRSLYFRRIWSVVDL
jgi:hypothetical protein